MEKGGQCRRPRDLSVGQLLGFLLPLPSLLFRAANLPPSVVREIATVDKRGACTAALIPSVQTLCLVEEGERSFCRKPAAH